MMSISEIEARYQVAREAIAGWNQPRGKVDRAAFDRADEAFLDAAVIAHTRYPDALADVMVRWGIFSNTFEQWLAKTKPKRLEGL